MTTLLFTILFYFILHKTHGENIAKEVEGGVQILNTGSLELVLPETLSFTVKRLKRSQLCIGDFVICYEATTTIMRDKQRAYYNMGTECPLGFCTLMVHSETAWYLKLDKRDEEVYARFYEHDRVCPRKVVNNRTNFTIIELPDCPVIVNGATLPKNTETTETSTATTVGIIVGCVILILLLSVVIVVVYCVCIRSNRQHVPPAKSNSPDQKAPKSPARSLRGKSPYD